MIELYQAEWCPYSRLVRERLTELGVDFLAHQVEPEPEDRRRLQEVAGTEEIPVLVDGDEVVAGHDEALAWLGERFRPGRHERDHKLKFREHAEDARR
jgi:glutaredoxin